MSASMDELVAKLKSALGEGSVLEGEAAHEKAQGAWSHLGTPRAVLRPSSTEEVSKALALCHQADIGIVPWGGKTGLVEGAAADGMLALSLDRMNAIEEIDETGGTATVQAGAILQTVCEAVEAKGYFFPLDLGGRGSATIGGNISTNAGGNRVLRYGMMRDMVLGIEAVLADGTVISSLNKLIKNNAGYDLKQLFIGSEGTLGVVTRAVLRLRPKPVSQDTTFVAVEKFDNLPKLLRHMERALGGTLSAYEVMWEDFYKLVTTEPAKGRAPIAHGHPYYVLIESMGGNQEEDSARFEAALTEALELGLASDAVIAKNQAERDEMWALRDDVGQVANIWPMFFRCEPAHRRYGKLCRGNPRRLCREVAGLFADGFRSSGRRQSARHPRQIPRCVAGNAPRGGADRLWRPAEAKRFGVGGARDRAREAALSRLVALTGGGCPDAHAETGARSEGHSQSRQGAGAGSAGQSSGIGS